MSARKQAMLAREELAFVQDSPIDHSVSYKTRVRGAARHFGFFPFFAKKPWPVVQEYIKHYTAPGDVVCDPFAGTGVTAVEALVLGRKAVAIDINPVALFITRMTAVSPVDLSLLRAAYAGIESRVRERIEWVESATDVEVRDALRALDYPRVPIPSTVKRAGAETTDQMHTPRQLAGLALLRNAINDVPDALTRDLLRVALANTVRYANRTYQLPSEGDLKRSPYRGDALFFRRYSYSFASDASFYEHKVWGTFVRSFEAVCRAKEETNRLIGDRYADLKLQLAPAAMIHQIAGESSFDYCFTDPPYSNDIYFLDLCTLWAAWLDQDITPEMRRSELIVGGVTSKSREQFQQEFAAAIQSIGKGLRPDRWLTLVYKHHDLSLWQSIVRACESNGLSYINSVWQELTIKSTRQHESPGINPSGDMYLNFRNCGVAQEPKKTQPSDLPTIANYVEKEVERLIVSYLGADIRLIASGVIQQVLNIAAFRPYHDHPDVLTEDIQKVLRTSRFETWNIAPGRAVWVLGKGILPDASLPPFDQARYVVFSFMRAKEEATEAQVSQYLLTHLGQHRNSAVGAFQARDLLPQVADPLPGHRWKFNPQNIVEYRQLRLLFEPSRADWIRQAIEHRSRTTLRANFEGLALLVQRLHSANEQNPKFPLQRKKLLLALSSMSQGLVERFAPLVRMVIASGDWAIHGIDLRTVTNESIAVDIVLQGEERSFELSCEFATKAFDFDDGEIQLEFRLLTNQEWEHALTVAGTEENLGIRLLDSA